jgi:hypothetical protein
VVQTSVYTRHFSPSPDHNNRQDLLGLERNEASGLLYGGATFLNRSRSVRSMAMSASALIAAATRFI